MKTSRLKTLAQAFTRLEREASSPREWSPISNPSSRRPRSIYLRWLTKRRLYKAGHQAMVVGLTWVASINLTRMHQTHRSKVRAASLGRIGSIPSSQSPTFLDPKMWFLMWTITIKGRTQLHGKSSSMKSRQSLQRIHRIAKTLSTLNCKSIGKHKTKVLLLRQSNRNKVTSQHRGSTQTQARFQAARLTTELSFSKPRGSRQCHSRRLSAWVPQKSQVTSQQRTTVDEYSLEDSRVETCHLKTESGVQEEWSFRISVGRLYRTKIARGWLSLLSRNLTASKPWYPTSLMTVFQQTDRLLSRMGQSH